MTTLIPKFDFKNGGSTPTGAVNRPINLKLGEWVSVNDFGAAGDGTTDDTTAIQAALNTGKTVILPSNTYLITDSLEILGQKIIGTGSTARTGSADTYAMTTIKVTGNAPAIIYTASTNVTFEIEGLRIVYNDGVMPTTSTGHDQQIGFYFNNPTFPSPPNGMQFSKISNCMVFGAWQAYYQDGGGYLTRIERFWSWNCYKGFYSKGGTTLEFDTCYVLAGCVAWDIESTVGLTITNSGFDQCVLTADSPSKTLCLFSAIDNFTFNEFQAEANTVEEDFGSVILFYSCAGSLSGFNTWGNTIKNLTANQDVYLVLIQQSWIAFNGCNPVRGAGALIYTGAAGFPATIAVTSYSFVNATSCLIRVSTGGTPTANYSLSSDNTSLATYDTSTLEGSVVANPTAWQTTGSITPVLNSFTVTGTPILTGNYSTTRTVARGTVTATIKIDPNGGTIAATGGVSNVTGLNTLPLIVTPVVTSSGIGTVNTFGQIYVPSISTTSSPVYITVTYNI
jgi:hypothetical protein